MSSHLYGVCTVLHRGVGMWEDEFLLQCVLLGLPVFRPRPLALALLRPFLPSPFHPLSLPFALPSLRLFPLSLPFPFLFMASVRKRNKFLKSKMLVGGFQCISDQIITVKQQVLLP
jgi:hypothetical protein